MAVTPHRQPGGRGPSDKQGEESTPAIGREGRQESQTDQTLLQLQVSKCTFTAQTQQLECKTGSFLPS